MSRKQRNRILDSHNKRSESQKHTQQKYPPTEQAFSITTYETLSGTGLNLESNGFRSTGIIENILSNQSQSEIKNQ